MTDDYYKNRYFHVQIRIIECRIIELYHNYYTFDDLDVYYNIIYYMDTLLQTWDHKYIIYIIIYYRILSYSTVFAVIS